jgi:RND family efflux transporter MFP subunit
MAKTLRYVGTVGSRREINLVARVNGNVTSLPVAEGELAAANALLVQIGSPEMQARASRAKAEHARAQTEASFACTKLEADEKLAASGALAAVQLDNSRRQCNSARSAVGAAEAVVQETQSLLAYANERAPFPGIVLRHHVKLGEQALPGKPLLLYGDLKLEIVVQVAERDALAGIAPDTSVQLSAGASTWRSKVISVAPMAKGPGRTVEVRISVPPNATGLRHGMSAEVNFITAEDPEATAVPTRAVIRDGEGAAVFVLAEADRVRRFPVKTGLEADGWTAIFPPPPGANALVVSSGAGALSDGDLVFPVSEDRDAL